MARRIVLEGVDNFRDFGDYPAADGRRVKAGRLFRSAHHGKATDADLEVIDALGIATIVDLRRPGERARDPSRTAPTFTGQVLASDHPESGEDEWHAHLKTSDLTPQSFRAYLLHYYDRAPLNRRHLDLFSRYFQTLAEAEGPVLIHCAAGKDRTGILAALTLRLVGAHPDDVIADYMLTNDEDRFRIREPQIEAAVRELTGRAPAPNALRIAMGVEPEYLDRTFQAIEREFGDFDGYFEQGLRVDRNTRQAVTERLLG